MKMIYTRMSCLFVFYNCHKNDLNYKLNILGPLCHWQCLDFCYLEATVRPSNRSITVGADHQLHDGLDDEGERGHGYENRDEGAEELHEGDGGGVPQQDHLRLQECDKETLHDPLDNQRTGTKGLISSLTSFRSLHLQASMHFHRDALS